MTAEYLVNKLIGADYPQSARNIIEASVRLPPRGSRWIATYTDENGKQVWKSTGQRDRTAAQVVADKWAAEAKRKRAAQGGPPRKPTIRVRHGSGEHALGLFTQAETAAILNISERAVRAIERRAFEKLRNHPALKDFWREWQTGELKEGALPTPMEMALSQPEIVALYGLAEDPMERQALRKLIALTQASSE